MANINIKFNNKDYLLSCDDGQEEDLKNLTKFLDKKYLSLKEKLGNIGENKLLLITSIQVIDEYFDLKKRVNSQKETFEDLSKKFKEMKSLVINYKDGKETEISKLNTELIIALLFALIFILVPSFHKDEFDVEEFVL